MQYLLVSDLRVPEVCWSLRNKLKYIFEFHLACIFIVNISQGDDISILLDSKITIYNFLSSRNVCGTVKL